MPKTKAELKNAYAKKAYDDIRLQVKKGMKEEIKEHAKAKGYNSLQGYINSLIEADMKPGTQSEDTAEQEQDN